MRKYLAATAVGALLVAGQVAAQDSAVVNLGDRLGSGGSSFVCRDDDNNHHCCREDNNNDGRYVEGCRPAAWIALASGLFIALIAWGFSQSGNGTPATP